MKRHTQAGIVFLAICLAIAAGIYSQIRPVAPEPTVAGGTAGTEISKWRPAETDHEEGKPDNPTATTDCVGTWTDGNSPELEIRITPAEYSWKFDGEVVSQGAVEINAPSPNILLKFDGRTFAIDCTAKAITVESEPASEENGWIPRGDSWEMSPK